MTTRKLPLLTFALFALWQGRPAQAQQIVVIANRSAHVEEIGAGELRAIFLGDSTHFRGGARAEPVLLRSGKEHDEFLAAYIGKVDASFRSYWRSMVFTGQAAMPRSAEDDAAMMSYVASTPGGIGYVSQGTALREGVAAVTVRDR